jgi:MFS family permease
MSTVEISAPVPASQAVATRSFADVWLISLGHMLTHWYPATFYLLLPLIGNELGLSYGQIGSILTCQFVCGSLSNIPGGMIADAVSRKGMLMALALCWVGAPYLLMSFTHSYWTLLGCAGLVGIGNNFGTRLRSHCWRVRSRSARASWFRSMAWAATSAMRSRRSPPVFCWRA